MTRRLALTIAAGLATAGLVAWLIIWGAPSWLSGTDPAGADAGSAAGGAGRRINATLFYVTEDGSALRAVSREVPYAATPAEQAGHIVAAALQPPPAGLLPALPPEAALRSVFVTDTGEAFVDLSAETAAAHRGGSLTELLSVYAIVNAVTVSLPDVRTVQILIDGREVETLAGHVDLRHPLPKNTTWVRQP